MFDETKASQEPVAPQIKLEIKTREDLTNQDWEMFSRFVDQQVQVYSDVKVKPSEEFTEKGVAASVHTFALTALESKLKPNEQFQVIFGKNHAGELLGYSLVLIDKSKHTGSNTFLGVDDKYQHRGIGTMLLKARHEDLKASGIISYITSAREEVLKMYEKLGVRYTIHPRPIYEITSGKLVTVYLN